MGATIYYVVALLLWAVLALKIPALRRDWHDPLTRALCGVLLFAGATWALAAPSSVAVINRIVGIPNIAAPLVYSVIAAYSTACLVLMAGWGYPDSARARGLARISIASCVLISIALFILFALGNAPQERLSDLDLYYANTPYIDAMIMLYLLAEATAAAITSILCLSWAIRAGIRGSTRAGLAVLCTGFTLNAAHAVLKLVAVIGTRMGHDMYRLGITVAPQLVAVGAVLVCAGYLIPVAGARIESALVYVRLGPLSHHLTSGTKYAIRLSRWSPLQIRLTSRQTCIQDGIVRIAAYLDPAIQQRAQQAALAAGATHTDAQAIGDAAMVVQAAAPGGSRPAHPARLVTSVDHLVRVSRAIHTPIVESVRDLPEAVELP